ALQGLEVRGGGGGPRARGAGRAGDHRESVGAGGPVGREADSHRPDDRGLPARQDAGLARHRSQRRARARRRARPYPRRPARASGRALCPRSPEPHPAGDLPGPGAAHRPGGAALPRAVCRRLAGRRRHGRRGPPRRRHPGGAAHRGPDGAQADVLLGGQGGARAGAAADARRARAGRRGGVVRVAGIRTPPAAAAGGVNAARFVSRLTRKSRSNFFYAFLLLPRAQREAIFAVYAFCRLVDDAVDEGMDRAAQRRELARWREEIARVFGPEPTTHPAAERLREAVRQFPIPRPALEEIIAGVEMDLDRATYETFDDLYPYCYRVASAVGLCSIAIFGYRDPRAQDYAINLGVALQLTNILRDVQTDARMGRVYLPQEDLRRFGVTI